MQPCQVCGAVTVDPSGRCTGCGTFRTPFGQPVSGAPASTPATGGSPASGPSISGAPYPPPGPPPGPPLGPPPGPPPGPRAPRVLPLLLLTGLLAILAAALVAVTVLRGEPKHPGPKHPGSGTPSIDACLVGTWRTVTDREQVDVAGVGLITLVGQGAVVHIGPDGSDFEDYSTATPYQGTANGHTVSISTTGTVRSRLHTDAGTLSFQDSQAQGTVTITVDGVPGSPQPLQVNADPVGYTCAGDTSTETTSQYSSRLVRISGTP